MSVEHSVILYLVTAKVYVTDRINEFEVNMEPNKAKETKSSYSWYGKRISKEKILKPDHYLDGEYSTGFRTYCFEHQLEQAKEILVKAVKKEVEKRLMITQKMNELIQEEPIVTIKELREEV